MCDKDENTGKWKLNATSVNVYAALVRLRNQELATHWTRYHVFAALNSAVLVAFANFSGPRSGRILLELLGLTLTVLWWFFASLGKKQLRERCDAALIGFEAEVSNECGFHTFLTEWQKQKEPIHRLQLAVPVIFLMIWLGAIVFWQPGNAPETFIQGKIAKTAEELKSDISNIRKAIEKNEDAILKLQTTLAAQTSSNTAKRKP